MSCGNPTAGETETGEPEQTIMPRKREIRAVDRSICQRCKLEKAKYVSRRMTYCSACYKQAIHLRINRQLYPPLRHPTSTTANQSHRALHRPFRQPGNVCIALSGGCGSMALLDVCLEKGYVGLKGQEGREVDRKKGEIDVVWEKGWVVWVDFSGVMREEEGERERRRGEGMKEWVEGKGLGWVGLKVEDVFDEALEGRIRSMTGQDDLAQSNGQAASYSVDLKIPGLPITQTPSTSQTPLQKLQTLLTSLPPSSRPALLSTILNHLLTLTAQSLPKISHLLLGETSTRQAQRIIAGTALGRGWSLPLELKGALPLPEQKTGDEEILRILPMKEISVKEAAILCHIGGLESWNWREWDRLGGEVKGTGKGGTNLSIEGLTERFIAGLNVTHPATVSTINKTGDKLVFAGGRNIKEKLCPLCQMPIDESADEWKSRTALTSLPGKTSLESVAKQDDNEKAEERRGELGPLLCYACLTTMRISKPRRPGEGSDTIPLPLWVGRRAVERQDIAKFLLDGGEEKA